MSKNKNGIEKLTNETPVPEDMRQALVARLVENYRTKKVLPRRSLWGVTFGGQRADGRLRFRFDDYIETEGHQIPCACGLGCELGGKFLQTGAEVRSLSDLAAIRLRRQGFLVTKEFCDGFVQGFDNGDPGLSGSPQRVAGYRTGAEVWNQVKGVRSEIVALVKAA